MTEFFPEQYLINRIIIITVWNMKIFGLINKPPGIRPHNCLLVLSGGIIVCIQYPVLVTALGRNNNDHKKEIPAWKHYGVNWNRHKFELRDLVYNRWSIHDELSDNKYKISIADLVSPLCGTGRQGLICDP